MATLMAPGDVGLRIRVDGGAWRPVILRKAGVDDDTEVGAAEAKLLFGNNAPTFTTYGEMVVRLADIAGLSLDYDAVKQEISFDIPVTTLFDETIDIPLDFDLDLSPLAEISSETMLSLNVQGEIGDSQGPGDEDDLKLTIGVSLGDADPAELIQTTTPLADLNSGDGVEISTTAGLLASNPVQATTWHLSGDAEFRVFINGNPTAVPVTVTKASTLNNASEGDLAADLNTALGVAGVELSASIEDSRIKFSPTGATISFRVEATGGDPAARELGIGANQGSQQLALVLTPDAPSNGQILADADDPTKAASFALQVASVGAPLLTNANHALAIDSGAFSVSDVSSVSMGDILKAAGFETALNNDFFEVTAVDTHGQHHHRDACRRRRGVGQRSPRPTQA